MSLESREVFVRCVHRRVHGIERQIEQEGTRLLAPDEVHRAIGERVGEIRHGGYRLSPIENRIDAAAAVSRYECSPPRNPKNSSKPRDMG